jgi:hypothetical protein
MVKYIYQKLNWELARAHQWAQDALLTKLQQKYDYKQPILEVQQQLLGIKLSKAVNNSLKCLRKCPRPRSM